MMDDWEIAEKMPRFDDVSTYEVWIGASVRKVKRSNNQSCTFFPGTLLYVDCRHPIQNVLCDESKVQAWRRCRT